MNYYVLYCQTLKMEKVCFKLNRNHDIYAYIPKMEKYIRKIDTIVQQPMFPGYVFVKTILSQTDFSTFIMMNEDKDGIIKELKKEDVSALTKEEIDIFNHLLDENNILKMSVGKWDGHITTIIQGPLVYFQDRIVAVNKKDMFAVLNIEFLNRNIKAGVMVQAGLGDTAQG